MSNEGSVLITGATGFIGSRLAEHFASTGTEVHVVVRSSSKLDPLERFLDKIHVHTLGNSTRDLLRIMRSAAPRCVYHLASLFIAEHEVDDVSPLIESNIHFGAQLLDAMRESGVPSIVSAGTSWQHFANCKARPSCLYAATKEAFEVLARYYADAFGLKVVTLTLFDSYGPGDPRRKLFWHLRRAAETGARLPMSLGNQVLQMVYLDDIVRAFVVAGERLVGNPASSVEVFRLQSQQAMTLRQIVATYERVVQRPIDVVWGGRPYREREVFEPWTGDPILPGWKPQVGLEEGIQLMEGITAQASKAMNG